MLANFHTHSTFCDGKNTPEEIIKASIEKGLYAIGFSGHGYTPFDLRYCMKDTDGYLREISALKEKYKDKIQVYLGVEEDAFFLQDRKNFDYIIGSSHYFLVDGAYYPIDSGYDYFKKCLDVFSYDIENLTKAYYEAFCTYINSRKPDIIGHFDLITKFDELDDSLFLENPQYNALAEFYVKEAAKSQCIFEFNTGAISRGFRKNGYPNENLLHVLKKNNSRLILSADSHNVDTLVFGFDEAKKFLKEVGFKRLTTINNGKFVEYDI